MLDAARDHSAKVVRQRPDLRGHAMPPQQGPLRPTELRKQIQSAFNLYTVDRDNSSWEIQRQTAAGATPGQWLP